MGILDNAKEIADLIKKYNDQELYEKLVDLREQILNLREENMTLKQNLEKLKNTLKIEVQLFKEGNCYFKKNDTERKHPYCMTCWDVDKNLVSLIINQSRVGKTMYCNICNKR